MQQTRLSQRNQQHPLVLQEKPSFYLIVETVRNRNTKPQYWLVNDRDVVDVPLVSHATVYTGKQIRFRNEEVILNGTCVLISSDLQFVKDQLAQFATPSENMDANDKTPSVLGMSTKGNVMTTNNHNHMLHNGKRPLTKLTNAITIKSVKKLPPLKEEKNYSDMDFVQVSLVNTNNNAENGENVPPSMDMPTVLQMMAPPKVMTFDQQSQTDFKTADYDNGVVPATAAQMHQQASQIAQLIRANNGLVIEVRQLKENSNCMKEKILDLDRKLDRALELLTNLPTTGGKAIKQENHNGLATVDHQPSEVITEPTSDFTELSNCGDFSISYANVPSREQSVTKSEYTPPLKKNKLKLSNSMLQLADTAIVDGVVIGPNGTIVPENILRDLTYENYSAVTRRILVAVFDRETLATHSLTGRPSPAFLDRDAKLQLDARKVQDIVDYVSTKCKINETTIRGVITSKCADENKMSKMTGRKPRLAAMEHKTVKRRTMH